MLSNRPRWSNATKLTISLLVLAFIIYLLFRFSIVIPPFILAVVLAYIISPITSLLNKRLRIPRILAILVSYLLLLILASIIPIILIPLLTNELTQVNLDIQAGIDWLQNLRGQQFVIVGQTIDFQNLTDQLVSSFEGMLEPVVGSTLSFLVEVISSLVWVIFIFIVSFYIVKDGQNLQDYIETRIPPALRQDFIRLRSEISMIWSAFFRGQLLLALVVAITFTIVGVILGLPFALLMGILAGLLEFLPSIGHGIWLFLASILALALGSTWIQIPNWIFMLIIIGLHIVFQQLDLNYLIPRIIGRRLHLPPLVVILGIVTGAVLAGIIGITLAAPTIASIRILGRYVYANLFDMDPFPLTKT